jgi:hypothetical protein
MRAVRFLTVRLLTVVRVSAKIALLAMQLKKPGQGVRLFGECQTFGKCRHANDGLSPNWGAAD